MTTGSSSGLKRAASGVGLFTLVSRILGFLRDALTASYVGAGFYSDAFFVAFRIPNLFRRLFAEGALTIAFVPIFTRLLIEQGKEAAQRFTRSAFTVQALLLTGLVIVAEIFAPQITWIFASGFSPEKMQVTTRLLQIVFPYIALVSMAALSMGVLNSLKHFSTPAFSPSLLNIAMILTLIISPWLPWHPAYSLAVGVVLGGVLQFGLQVLTMARHEYQMNFAPLRPVPNELWEMGRLMIPSILGAAAYQFNILINTQLASHLNEGSVSYLYYSDRLIEFPLAMVAVSLGTVLLPYLSSNFARGDMEGLKRTLLEAMRSLYFLMLPAMAGMIILRLPIVELLYQRRAFTADDAEKTAYALLFSALGLLGIGTLRIILPVFYAMKDTWTPFMVSIASMVINLVAALSLMQPLQHGGLALAITISSTCNALLLVYILRRRIGRIGIGQISRVIVRMSIATLAMSGLLYAAKVGFGWSSGASLNRFYFAATLLGTISVAAIFYFYVSHLLKIEESQRLVGFIRRKLGR